MDDRLKIGGEPVAGQQFAQQRFRRMDGCEGVDISHGECRRGRGEVMIILGAVMAVLADIHPCRAKDRRLQAFHDACGLQAAVSASMLARQYWEMVRVW